MWASHFILLLIHLLQELPKAPATKVVVPVRYEMKGYNSLLGSHFDHYYLEYDDFSFDSPSAEVFKIPASEYVAAYGIF